MASFGTIGSDSSTVTGGGTVGPAGPAGPTGPAGPLPDQTLTNGTGATIAAGVPVSVTAGLAGLAASTAALPAVGVAVADIAAGASGAVRMHGPLQLADWTAATGAASLSPGSPYFLHATLAGRLTVSPPTTAGRTVQRVGIALTADTMDVNPMPPVLL